jgi:hypothetical protein
MVATPAKTYLTMVNDKASLAGHRDPAMGVSTASVSSASSQDSAYSTQATSLLGAAERARSRSPLPSAVEQQKGLGFGATQYTFPPVASQNGEPSTPPASGQKNGLERFLAGGPTSNGLVAAAAMAAQAEATAQSEAEEAASILVHSVATTPRHHRNNSSVSQFQPYDYDGDVTMVRGLAASLVACAHGRLQGDGSMADIPVTSTPIAGRTAHSDAPSPCPTLPSFCTSSPAMPSAPPSRDPGHPRSVLPVTSPSAMHTHFGFQPSSSRTPSEASFASSQVQQLGSAVKGSGNKRKAGKRNGGAGGPSDGADPSAKPPYSYAGLIGQAIMSTDDHRLSLNDIYNFIMSHYPYYKKEDSGWQNSIRHNLSLNECFVKTQRDASNPGKGCLWSILAGTEDQFADGNFVKRSAMGKKKAAAAAAVVKSEAAGPSSSGSATATESRPKPGKVKPPSKPKVATRAAKPVPVPADAPMPEPLLIAQPPPRRAASIPAKRSASRELSAVPSEQLYEEEEDDEDEEEEEEAGSEDDYAPPGEAAVASMASAQPAKRQRQDYHQPEMAAHPQMNGIGIHHPAFLTSPAISTSHAMATFPIRGAATSPPPFIPPQPSPPSSVLKRMQRGHDGYAETSHRLSRATTPAAHALMSSPPPISGHLPGSFWPPAHGNFLQAPAAIGGGPLSLRDRDEDAMPLLGSGSGLGVVTQSPVSSMRSSNVPIASPLQKRQQRSMASNAHDALASLRGASAPGPFANATPGPFTRSLSPPEMRSSTADADALLRTPPSSHRTAAARQTPRRPASAGLLETPRPGHDWRLSSDPYDPEQTMVTEIERVGQRSPDKGLLPFSTPGATYSPW